MRILVVLTAIILLVSVFASACAPQPAARSLDEVRLQLTWQHQAQFAGFYAADQKGYYAEEGLRVTLLPNPARASDPVKPVVEGRADFGVTQGAALIIARSQGQPVVAVAALYQQYPLVFMTLADSGITRPQDFPGHTVNSLTPGSAAELSFRAMMAKLDLDPASVRQVDIGIGLPPFYAGKVDIRSGFITNEVLAARRQGYQVNLIMPQDYGVHLYGDTLFATARLVAGKPDLTLRFVRATLRGWRWAIENPAEAGRLALIYDPNLDEAQQVAMMEASVPLIRTGQHPVGWMDAETWQAMQTLVAKQGLLTGSVKPEDVYSLDFLQRVYGGGAP